MSVPIGHPQSRQHNLGDWLDLHGLDRQSCLDLLDEIRREFANIPAYRNNPDQQALSLDPDGVWTKIISAMCQFLPEHQNIIEETFQRSKKIAISGQGKSRKALTIDHGPDQYPTIMYKYFGEISDIIVVAHEFGHALQIKASEGKFMPPVMREACAFLAEGAILSSCSNENAPIIDDLLNHWHKSNHRYFGKLAMNLKESLENDDKIYEYGWNYPIARFLALRISESFSPELIWSVFRGDYSVRRVLDRLAL